MSADVMAVIRVVHLVAALLMAAPLYMLVVVNERGRFAVPPGHNTDRFMENIIKNQPRRCYMYLGAILITGLLLLDPTTGGYADRLAEWPILVKLGILVALAGTLSYVHLGIQPKVEAVLAGLAPNDVLPEDKRPTLVRFRIRRKRLSSICLFLVVTAFIMGVRAFMSYSPLVTLALMVLAALFAWRVYKRPIPWGWV
ncbi:MAG: hypothetical protein HY681_08875 [Chloroflexi bacterium]|nr:hypothetical protein [Chloroflexota bacterium]